MLDHTHRCIFIHQRKAAGSSIISAFGYTSADEAWHTYNNGVLTTDWDERPAGYLVFSAVRNPFDRLISSWKYLKAYQDRSLREVLENPPRKGHDFRHLTRPQVAMLKHPGTGQLVTDDLVRYESAQADFDRICTRIGKVPITLPRSNVNHGRERDWRSYYDDHTRELAASRFRDDLETFGYSFDGPG
jgi:hypothetical protein